MKGGRIQRHIDLTLSQFKKILQRLRDFWLHFADSRFLALLLDTFPAALPAHLSVPANQWPICFFPRGGFYWIYKLVQIHFLSQVFNLFNRGSGNLVVVFFLIAWPETI